MNAAQHIAFGFCDWPIGARNLHQSDQHIFQHGLIVGEGLAQFFRKGFPALGGFPRLIEKPAHLAKRFFRYMEKVAEGRDFFPLDRPIHLGKLGRKHNDRKGKQVFLGAEKRHQIGRGRRNGATLAAKRPGIRGMAKRRTDHGAEWPAHGEARHPAQHLAPETQTASCMAKPNRFLSRKPSQPVDALPGPARQASGVKDQAPWQWPRTGKTPWPHPPRAGQTAARPLACPYRWPSQPAVSPPARPARWLE